MKRNRFLLVGIALLAVFAVMAQRGASADNYSQLLTLELQLQELKNDFGPDHPKVVSLKKQIEVMRRYVDAQNGPIAQASAEAGPSLNTPQRSAAVAQPLPDMSNGPGRYTLASNSTEIVLLDTHTGQSWLLQTRGRSSDAPAWVLIRR